MSQRDAAQSDMSQRDAAQNDMSHRDAAQNDMSHRDAAQSGVLVEWFDLAAYLAEHGAERVRLGLRFDMRWGGEPAAYKQADTVLEALSLDEWDAVWDEHTEFYAKHHPNCMDSTSALYLDSKHAKLRAVAHARKIRALERRLAQLESVLLGCAGPRANGGN